MHIDNVPVNYLTHGGSPGLIVELCYKTMRFRIINDDEIGSAGYRRVAACFIQAVA